YFLYFFEQLLFSFFYSKFNTQLSFNIVYFLKNNIGNSQYLTKGVYIMWHYYKLYWKKALEFKGRARRKELWFPFLVNILITILLIILLDNIFTKHTYFLYGYIDY